MKQNNKTFPPMLLGTLAASILRNALLGRGVIRAGEGVIRASQNFQCRLILILTYKNFIKMNLNTIVFIQKIIYLK